MTKSSAATDRPVRLLRPLTGGKLKQFVAEHWVFHAPADYTVEDLQHPGIWAANRDIKAGDRIEVQQPRRWTELYVHDAAPSYVGVSLIHTIELPERREEANRMVHPDFDIRRATSEDNAMGAYVVVRKRDGFIFAGQNQRLNSAEEGNRYLLDHAVVRQQKPKALTV